MLLADSKMYLLEVIQTNHAFLNFRADGDATLEQYLQLAPSNANYCGHQIQNEIIELCGKQIQNTILEKCK